MRYYKYKIIRSVKSIIDIWKDVIGVSSINKNINFFENGGSISLWQRAAKRIQGVFPLARFDDIALLAHHTPSVLAEILVDLNASGPISTESKNSDGRSPLYCIPGLMIDVSRFRNIPSTTFGARKVFGFNCYSFNRVFGEYLSIENIAEKYSQAFLKSKSSKSCLLLGWSIGGIIAYEVASQISDKTEIKMIGMIDVFGFDIEKYMRFFFSMRGVDYRSALLAMDPELNAGENRFEKYLARSIMKYRWNRLISRMSERTYEALLHFFHLMGDDLVPDGPDRGSIELEIWFAFDCMDIFSRYVLRPSRVPITAFNSQSSLKHGAPFINWNEYSKSENRSIIIPGTNHYDIIESTALHRNLNIIFSSYL